MSIFILIIFVYLCALIDSEHFKRHQFFRDHRSRFYLRALFVLVLGQMDYKITIGGALLFWALFDAMLNSMMDWNMFMIGDTSKIDRFFNSPFCIPWISKRKLIWKPITITKIGLYKVLKFVCLVGGFGLMII